MPFQIVEIPSENEPDLQYCEFRVSRDKTFVVWVGCNVLPREGESVDFHGTEYTVVDVLHDYDYDPAPPVGRPLYSLGRLVFELQEKEVN